MHWRAILVLVALSGCLGPAAPSKDLTPEPSTGDATKATSPDGSGLALPGSARLQNWSFDLRGLEYQNAMKSYALVADAASHVSLNWTVHLGQWAAEDSCAAGAVMSPSKTDSGPRANGAQFVAWAYRNDVRSTAHVAGQDVQLVPSLYEEMGSGELKAEFTGAWSVDAGARIVIQLGGDDPAFADARHISGSSTQSNIFNISLAVRGAAHLEPLPDVPLKCGVSLYEMEGSSASVESLASATVGGHVEVSSPGGLTMIFLAAPNSLEVPQEGTLTFLNESVPAEAQEFERTSLRGGEASIRMETWVEPLPSSPVWFLAATAWLATKTMKEI